MGRSPRLPCWQARRVQGWTAAGGERLGRLHPRARGEWRLGQAQPCPGGPGAPQTPHPPRDRGAIPGAGSPAAGAWRGGEGKVVCAVTGDGPWAFTSAGRMEPSGAGSGVINLSHPSCVAVTGIHTFAASPTPRSGAAVPCGSRGWTRAERQRGPCASQTHRDPGRVSQEGIFLPCWLWGCVNTCCRGIISSLPRVLLFIYFISVESHEALSGL